MKTRLFEITPEQQLTVATALHCLSHIMDTVETVFRSAGQEPPKRGDVLALANAFSEPPRSVDGVINLTKVGG